MDNLSRGLIQAALKAPSSFFFFFPPTRQASLLSLVTCSPPTTTTTCTSSSKVPHQWVLLPHSTLQPQRVVHPKGGSSRVVKVMAFHQWCPCTHPQCSMEATTSINITRTPTHSSSHTSTSSSSSRRLQSTMLALVSQGDGKNNWGKGSREESPDRNATSELLLCSACVLCGKRAKASYDWNLRGKLLPYWKKGG